MRNHNAGSNPAALTNAKSHYNKSERHYSNLENARLKALETKGNCQTCGQLFTLAGLHTHEKYCGNKPQKECPVCKEIFTPKSRSNPSVTCGTGCANTYFKSKENHPNWDPTKPRYHNICFSNHEKKCVICGEFRIVAVHHLDEDHDNNDPCNLIPMCPTHHQYWHSKHKDLVEEQVLEYIEKWKQNNCGVEQSGSSTGS